MIHGTGADDRVMDEALPPLYSIKFYSTKVHEEIMTSPAMTPGKFSAPRFIWLGALLARDARLSRNASILFRIVSFAPARVRL
jgi:hypothetical protein